MSILITAGLSSGLCFLVRFHACNMARPRRFGFTGFVICTTFFVELIVHNPRETGYPWRSALICQCRNNYRAIIQQCSAGSNLRRKIGIVVTYWR
jgi:hypothetical protein